MKRRAAQAGLDPSTVAGHSLRAGLATSAAAAGVPEREIANTTGHKGTVMLRRYIREGSLFRENAAAAVGFRKGEDRGPHSEAAGSGRKGALPRPMAAAQWQVR